MIHKVAIFILAVLVPATSAQPYVLSGTEPLPDIVIDGVQAKIHTQGLYVTDRHYLVTGRLENANRRAMLLRFDRRDLSRYEAIDLSSGRPEDASMDHPSGFDRDANGMYWIAVSTSHSRGPTIMYRVKIDEHRTLAQGANIKASFRMDDHLGAVSCLENDLLLAANWDSKIIYWIRTDGKLVKRLQRSDFIKDTPNWKFAVQDWKYIRAKGRLLAGGIDKGLPQGSAESNAVMAWVDLKQSTVEATRMKNQKGVSRPLTNEGMAWFENELFLLPEDLGRGAKVLRFVTASSRP